jgi:hypothetical protein
MSTLPWQWQERPMGSRVLVFASRFDGQGMGNGRRPRGAFRLMRHSLAIRRQVLRTRGAVGVSVSARPLRGEYYTLSAWQDEQSLLAFAHRGAHKAGVQDLYRRGPVTGVLIAWWEDATSWKPRWDDAIRRTWEATPGQYIGPDDSERRPAARRSVSTSG